MLAAFVLATSLAVQPPAFVPPFFVRVVDRATERGVPLVELRTVHGLRFVTDSAGVAAIDEPDLEGREVWFHVSSHGYSAPADGFGYRGFRATVARGSSRTLAIDRENVAERLYRVTGAGIYRDSVLAGLDAPISRPLLNGGVVGQDSVVTAIHRGRLFWFWGDTSRLSYPLGNFATAGAVSALPGAGLDPAVGIDLDYFVDEHGFARPMCPIDGPGPVWIDGLAVLDDLEQGESMLCHYARMKDLGTRLEHGIARWDDARERFVPIRQLPLDSVLHARGHPVRVERDGEAWLYFPDPYPTLRVRARVADLCEPSAYEAFTCLRDGARWAADGSTLARDADGRLAWRFARDTPPLTPAQWRQLADRGLVDAADGPMQLRDRATGERIQAHGGTIEWSPHLGRWVMVFLQAHGRSALGEVWFAEADDVHGPWRDATRIVTHARYSFYNVAQHACFATDGGRFVLFEGTYTAMFSGNDDPTPRYDYNQVMYRLDLDDPRLR